MPAMLLFHFRYMPPAPLRQRYAMLVAFFFFDVTLRCYAIVYFTLRHDVYDTLHIFIIVGCLILPMLLRFSLFSVIFFRRRHTLTLLPACFAAADAVAASAAWLLLLRHFATPAPLICYAFDISRRFDIIAFR